MKKWMITWVKSMEGLFFLSLFFRPNEEVKEWRKKNEERCVFFLLFIHFYCPSEGAKERRNKNEERLVFYLLLILFFCPNEGVKDRRNKYEERSVFSLLIYSLFSVQMKELRKAAGNHKKHSTYLIFLTALRLPLHIKSRRWGWLE